MSYQVASQPDNLYCIPKRRVTAEVILRGQRPLTLRLFLNERAETHGGRERPSDLLNGNAAFIAATDDNGSVILLQRDSLLAVSVAAVEELDEHDPSPEVLAPDDARSVMVEVTLEEGTLIRGTVTYLMPESQRRLQDYLNTEGRFLAVRDDEIIHLVNKGRVAQIRLA